MSEPRHKFTISRKTWINGNSAGPSVLLRPHDGHMCCLGFYFTSIGVSGSELWNALSPSQLRSVPECGQWLVAKFGDAGFADSSACVRLISENDRPGGSESLREENIRFLFAEQMIDVEFVD